MLSKMGNQEKVFQIYARGGLFLKWGLLVSLTPEQGSLRDRALWDSC